MTASPSSHPTQVTATPPRRERRWLAAAAIAALCACACNATEGALLLKTRTRARDAGSSSDGSSAATNPAVHSLVKAGMSLQYQLTGDVDTSVDAQLFVIDLFDTPQQKIAELHAKGRLVIAYVSVGSLEPWREDAATFPRSSVGMSLANYPNESWLDIRSPDVRAAIEARFDRAHDKGFDGVFASTLGGYLADTGFGLTRADELDYGRFLASAAHTRGLSPGLSGDFELGSEIDEPFEWALANACVARSNCEQLAPFTAQAKAVFDLETEGQHDAVCMKAASYGISTTFKHSSYDAWRMPCT